MHSTHNSAKQAYFEKVWRFVRQVPFCKVVTYGQIAQTLPEPEKDLYEQQELSLSRLVGSAMAACPDDVPWHRVVNAQGRVSSRADADRQRQLLLAEGHVFYQDRLNLEETQWHAEGDESKPQQHSLF